MEVWQIAKFHNGVKALVSTPSAPDPEETAAAQAQYNKETAIATYGLNATNQVTPYGNVTYDQIGTWSDGTPRYQQTTSLSDEQQAVLDQTEGAQLNLATLANTQSASLNDSLSKQFSFDPSSDAATFAYDLASPRILKQQAQNEEQIRSTLAAKGIREGSAAWNSEMTRLTNANTDQLNQLALNSEQTAYDQALQTYNSPVNTVTALMSGSQVTNPNTATSATPTTSVAGVDYTGLVNNQYNSQVSSSNAMMGGLFGLAAAPFSMFKFSSDRRLKKDIRQIGKKNGLNVYEFRYNWHKPSDPLSVGYMSDEVRAKYPYAVSVDSSGYDIVDYAKVS